MTAARAEPLTLALVGDVLLDREDPGSMFEHVAPILRGADVAIGNNEAVYAGETAYPPSAQHQVVAAPEMAEGLRESGFRAMSCANNHAVDGGHSGLLETLQRVRALGIATSGAGKDLTEARTPARVEVAGGRVALLSYASVFPAGYEARGGVPPMTEGVPGVAPLRVSTFYETPTPNMWLPGYAPRIRTIHWESDLADMVSDIERAAADAVVVVALHQGNSQRGGVQLDEYERVSARAAVDAGAHVVVAHHHSSLRGAEIYRGAPIFYGLDNFAFDLPHIESHFPPQVLAQFKEQFGENAFGPREGYPTYPFPPTYRNTAIAAVSIGTDGRARAGFVPAKIQPDGRPRPYEADTPEGGEIADYVRVCMEAVGRDWRVEPVGSFVAGHRVLEIVPADA